jgi:hypothetical protein
MKGFLKRVLGGAPEGLGEKTEPSPDSIEPGQVYSFKTRPYTEFGPAKTNRFAALKVLGVADTHVVIAVLDGVWPHAPTVKEVRATSVIDEHRLAYTGKPAVFVVMHDFWKPESDMDEFRLVGTQAVSHAERSFADRRSRFSTLHAADRAAEGEWRWTNDRDAFVIEVDRNNAKSVAERAAKEERYRTRLSKLTWEQLQSETPFEKWSPSPPFPPKEFTDAARAAIRSACEALKELGPKPRRADVRAVLKKTVIWFNEADERAGGVIETEEREDICAVLEEMAHVARQKVLVDEIDEWREW